MEDFFKSVPSYFRVVLSVLAFSWVILSTTEICLEISQSNLKKDISVMQNGTANTELEIAKIKLNTAKIIRDVNFKKDSKNEK